MYDKTVLIIISVTLAVMFIALLIYHFYSMEKKYQFHQMLDNRLSTIVSDIYSVKKWIQRHLEYNTDKYPTRYMFINGKILMVKLISPHLEEKDTVIVYIPSSGIEAEILIANLYESPEELIKSLKYQL